MAMMMMVVSMARFPTATVCIAVLRFNFGCFLLYLPSSFAGAGGRPRRLWQVAREISTRRSGSTIIFFEWTGSQRGGRATSNRPGRACSAADARENPPKLALDPRFCRGSHNLCLGTLNGLGKRGSPAAPFSIPADT